jgi:predicted site-specific integrase-resolvase
MSQRVAIYARVSTLHNQNPEMQLAELREYAARRGWEVTAEYVACLTSRRNGPARALTRQCGEIPGSWRYSGCTTRCSFFSFSMT